MITPPIGLNCFIVARYAHRPVGEVFHGTFPHFIAHLIAIAIFVAFPEIILWLPNHYATLKKPSVETAIFWETMMNICSSYCSPASAPSCCAASASSALPRRRSRLRLVDSLPSGHVIHELVGKPFSGTRDQADQWSGHLPAFPGRAARQGQGHGPAHRASASPTSPTSCHPIRPTSFR